MNTQDELICYAGSFVSFLLSNRNLWKTPTVKSIILFGSVARGDFDDMSDIDIFVDLYNKKDEERVEKIVNEQLSAFVKSGMHREWHLKGVNRNVKCMVGILEEWKLKRSIISDGIVLFGKYVEAPAGLVHWALFIFKPINDIAKRNRVIRGLFGYKSSKGKKVYKIDGLIKQVGGSRLSPNTFILPIEQTQIVLKLLQREKVDYEMREVWIEK